MNLDSINFIDIHYHANPDLFQRRYSVLEVGKKYQQAKGAVVLKSHLGSTTIQATIAQQMGLPVFPSLVLNQIAGGIHYRVIVQALSEYQPVIPTRLVVHLPTITGRHHESKLVRTLVHPHLRDHLLIGETIFNENGKLKPEVIDILKLAVDYPIVLSSGHASKSEVYALIDACDRYNVPALLLNQPANPLTGLVANELLTIARCPYVWFEQTALTYLLNYQTEIDFSQVLKRVPRVIYTSDLGQTSQMDIEEWLATSNLWFSTFNIPTQKKAELCLINPLRLLTI